MELKPGFNERDVLHKLKHFLPAQAPLKDFIHHNTLHAFQNKKFYDALREASEIFGYKVSLTLKEYRERFNRRQIREDVLERVITERFGPELVQAWKNKLLTENYDTSVCHRVGSMRANWKTIYDIDLDVIIQPELFKIVCSYLDQGISIWAFPGAERGFLNAIREIEKNSYSSFFKTPRARKLFLNTSCELVNLLKIVVGDETQYEHYLYDQQFAHQGWSGMVSVIEDQPQTLVDERKISLKEFVVFELLLEIDALDHKFGEIWSPLGLKVEAHGAKIFDPIPETEYTSVMLLWQDAFEWSYYDEVLSALIQPGAEKKRVGEKTFQAMFCIDDRELSLRTYIEAQDKQCETFGTPGFFNVEFYFQPEFGKSYTKLCPAPVNPQYLIKEIDTTEKRKTDLHFAKYTHSVLRGWIFTQTFGFFAAFRLFLNVFRPRMTPASASSFKQMDKSSTLTIVNKNLNHKENNLQLGFTVVEMADRVEGLLKSIGLVNGFAKIIYIIGHGSSSVNNTHYSAYDCGACSGRPGSVNARVISFMANNTGVRAILKERGLIIPTETQFLGGVHDTTRDEFAFFDETSLSVENLQLHRHNEELFKKALDLNAKERSRRLASINTKNSAETIHKKMLLRSVSLFEPRPELNHATNALCIVGKRTLSEHLFLDRRAFLNSYDYSIDPQGQLLVNIMKPLGPVCGGINLEYFFSRVDNHKLGAGTKLPHNVMGLFGVANGIDGDLRPGLPIQMVEVHDPVRLLLIVEHFPDVVLKTIQSVDAMYEWFNNEWVHLVTIDPLSKQLHRFKNGTFIPYTPLKKTIETIGDLTAVFETTDDNIPVFLLK